MPRFDTFGVPVGVWRGHRIKSSGETPTFSLLWLGDRLPLADRQTAYCPAVARCRCALASASTPRILVDCLLIYRLRAAKIIRRKHEFVSCFWVHVSDDGPRGMFGFVHHPARLSKGLERRRRLAMSAPHFSIVSLLSDSNVRLSQIHCCAGFLIIEF
jgi:hypothetical protein